MIEFKKVFVDTSPFIYYLEQNPMYYEKAKFFFENCYTEDRKIITSAITVEEYCVYPYYNQNEELIRKFEEFIEDMEIKVVDIDCVIAREAAKIRAEYKNFKAMDALQIATAISESCDLFLTNDKQLKQEKTISCLIMDDIK